MNNFIDQICIFANLVFNFSTWKNTNFDFAISIYDQCPKFDKMD